MSCVLISHSYLLFTMHIHILCTHAHSPSLTSTLAYRTKLDEDKKGGKRASTTGGERKVKCLPLPRPPSLTPPLPPLPGESRGEVRGVG
ncbi:hypothetical protein EON63_20830, partial [archaeon]